MPNSLPREDLILELEDAADDITDIICRLNSDDARTRYDAFLQGSSLVLKLSCDLLDLYAFSGGDN